MINAIIVNNIPMCKCGHVVGNGTGEYRLIIHQGKNYIEFVKFCSNPKCQEKIKYQCDITLDEVFRFSFSDDIKEVKDDDSNN